MAEYIETESVTDVTLNLNSFQLELFLKPGNNSSYKYYNFQWSRESLV